MQAQIASASTETHGFSLATGAARRELAVLAHEAGTGNWSRFGGSLGVLAERTGAINLLFSATGASLIAAAAGIAAVIYEIAKGAESFNALTKASGATNDYIGMTSGQLKQMAVDLAGMGGSITDASATLTALISSGRVSGDTLLEAGRAAQAFAQQTGLAADKAAEAMIAFAANPSKALQELQEHYHEFSAAQVNVIEGYIKEGNVAAATAAAYADIAAHHKEMTSAVLADMGLIVGSYEGWKIKLESVANWLGNIGRASTQAENYASAVAAAAKAQENYNQAAMMPFGNTASAKAGLDAANAQLAVQKKLQDAATAAAAADKKRAAGGDAQVRLNSYLNDTTGAGPAAEQKGKLDKEAQKFAEDTKDVDTASAGYQAALKLHYERVAEINAQYAKKTRVKSPNEDGINAAIKALNAQTDQLKAVYQQQNDAAKASYATGAIDAQTFIALQLQYQEQELAGEAAIAQKQADIAKGKKQTVAMTEYLNTVKKIYGEMDSAASKAAEGIIAANQKQADAIAKFSTEQNSKTKTQQQGYDDFNATQGMTSDDAAKANAKLAIVRDYYKTLENLEANHNANQITLGVYDSDKQAAATAYTDQLQQLQQQQDKQLAVQNDYYTQVKNAMTASTGNAQTNAQLMGSAFSSAYSTMSSQLETFITTGKGSWASFTESIIADFAKIALKAAEQQIFTSAISMFSGGGAVHAATGGAITGAGSGTSDSIPAMLSNGEYVINAASTKKYGSLLDSINSGTMSHYATGGAVGSVSPSSSSGSGSNISLSLGAGNQGLTMADLQAIAPHIQTLVDKRMAQKMGGQGGYSDMIRQGKI